MQKHNVSCKVCKQRVFELLKKIYGKVEKNYSVDIATKPEYFSDSNQYPKLDEIFSHLSALRGYTDLVQKEKLNTCDYFIPDKQIVVEFDEPQHFTTARKKSLELYKKSDFSFDVKKWIKLCEETNAKDNDKNVPHRDEQRAWLDTIRDFIPLLKKNFNPTIRLYAKDFVWCSLDPENSNDVKKFQSFLNPLNMEIINEPNSQISRIIIKNAWQGNPDKARYVLENVCDKWPYDTKTLFLQTPGAFIQFKWPGNLTRKIIGDNKNPNPDAVAILMKCGEKVVRETLPISLQKKLSLKTNYISLGVDSQKKQGSSSELHTELVCLVNLKKNTFRWTGKSLPLNKQEKGLVRITDFSSHFFDLPEGKTMILGCHDLTIYNERGFTNAKGWRKQTYLKFREIAKKQKPKFVLQHPHETVKIKTWLHPIKELERQLHSPTFAASGKYYMKEVDIQDYNELIDVLSKTKNCATLDFIIDF